MSESRLGTICVNVDHHCGDDLVEKVITRMTTAHIVLDLRSLNWGFGSIHTDDLNSHTVYDVIGYIRLAVIEIKINGREGFKSG